MVQTKPLHTTCNGGMPWETVRHVWLVIKETHEIGARRLDNSTPVKPISSLSCLSRVSPNPTASTSPSLQDYSLSVVGSLLVRDEQAYLHSERRGFSGEQGACCHFLAPDPFPLDLMRNCGRCPVRRSTWTLQRTVFSVAVYVPQNLHRRSSS